MARQVMLAAQGLDHPPDQPAVKADVLEAIRRMGLLQIDTIHVVARSPYLVLWSRLGDYQPEWLDELLAEGALFEYWAHAMCFLPIEDYPLYRRRMLDAIKDKVWPVKWAVKWAQENPEVMERVRTHLQENGAVRSAEFENKNHPSGGWWNWKEEKDALEAMLMTGEVMIARRQNFQRVYDLRERVLPGWDDAAASLQRRAPPHAGPASGARPGDRLPGLGPRLLPPAEEGHAQAAGGAGSGGPALRVEVEGLEGSAYVHPDRLDLLEEAASGRPGTHADHAALPFRSPGMGPAAGARAVRFRLYDRMLYAGRKAPLRLFHPAHPAPRPDHRPAGPQGSPGARGL